MWNDVSNRTSRDGKQRDKRNIVQAWLVDPTFSGPFLKLTMSVTRTDLHEKTSMWVSRTRLLEEYSESEAEELVRCGSIQTRPHPDNPSRLQFKFVQNAEKQQTAREERVTTGAKQDLSDEGFDDMRHTLKNVDLPNAGAIFKGDMAAAALQEARAQNLFISGMKNCPG
jgi:hypothetical protein